MLNLFIKDYSSSPSLPFLDIDLRVWRNPSSHFIFIMPSKTQQFWKISIFQVMGYRRQSYMQNYIQTLNQSNMPLIQPSTNTPSQALCSWYVVWGVGEKGTRIHYFKCDIWWNVCIKAISKLTGFATANARAVMKVENCWELCFKMSGHTDLLNEQKKL